MTPTSANSAVTTDRAPADRVVQAKSAFSMPDDLLYVDCAALGPRLRSVTSAGLDAIEASATPWALTWEAWEARIEALRNSAADLLFDGDRDGLAMVPSAAHGIATAARNLPLAAGNAVLVLDGQFPSNLLPWQQRCTEIGARMVAVRRNAEQDWSDAICAALDADPRVRIVALSHVDWIDGASLDLDRIAPQVHACGAALVLDLSQSLGMLPVNLAHWRPDFIVAVGFKWLLASNGLAWLWASPRWRDAGIAIDQHWSARDAGEDWRFSTALAPPYRRGARRFDAGGVADAPRLAMAQAALDKIADWEVPWIATQLRALTAAFDEALDAHGLDAWKTRGHAPHFTALRPPANRLRAVADGLRRERVICTERYGLLRIAPHLHVDTDDMRRVAAIAAKAARD